MSIVARLATQEAAAKANAPARYVEILTRDVEGRATPKNMDELAEVLDHLGLTAADAQADRSALAEVRRLSADGGPDSTSPMEELGKMQKEIQAEQDRHKTAMRELNARLNQVSLALHAATAASGRVRARIQQLRELHPRVFGIPAQAVAAADRPVMTGSLPTPGAAEPGQFGRDVAKLGGIGETTRKSIQTGGVA